MIRTGQFLADIAESLGYEVLGIDLCRTRIATATKEQLREEVVLLRWPGTKYQMGSYTLRGQNRYAAIIEKIFQDKFQTERRVIDFEREEIVRVGEELRINLPKNLVDVVYSFRFRAAMPESIQKVAPEGESWIIRLAGRGKYRFALTPNRPLLPNENLTATKIPDATPGIVAKYALSDEQALLAKVRYVRLLDIFTGVSCYSLQGVSCYSLQNHLRTTVPNIGQVETDELYVGVDKKGVHYVFPLQAKGGNDNLSIVQTEQDFALCADKFPSLVCRPIAAQFMRDDVIALFEFEEDENGIGVAAERHYKLVSQEEVTEVDLETYRNRTAG
jgi:hypothetical protein